MKNHEGNLLQWHPAFFAGIQIELEAEAEELIFKREHNLGTKPINLVSAYSKHDKNQLYKSIMNIIIRANHEAFKEAKMMCEALRELMKDEIEQGIAQGIAQGISQGIAQGIEQGEEKKLKDLICKKFQKGKSIDQIADELEETIESIMPLYNQVVGTI